MNFSDKILISDFILYFIFKFKFLVYIDLLRTLIKKQNKSMSEDHSNIFQSQTQSILLKLQKKIQCYLSPSYQNCEDVFDRSKVMKKNHVEIVQNNKQFLKNKQKLEYEKQESRNYGNQSDDLVHRRKKCQAKIYKMLFNHQIQQQIRIDFSQIDQNGNKKIVGNNFDQFMSTTSVKKQKISMKTPQLSQPNFIVIQKQLQKIQKKLENLENKVERTQSQKKTTKIKGSKNKFSQIYKGKNNQSNREIQKTSSQKLLSSNPWLYSSKISNSKPPLKKIKSAAKIKSDGKLRIQNSQNVGFNLFKHRDQISLAERLNQNSKTNNLNKRSGLKKVGASKLNVKQAKCVQNKEFKKNFQSRDIKQTNQNRSSNKQKIDLQQNKNKSQNHIKVNLIHCKSQQIL